MTTTSLPSGQPSGPLSAPCCDEYAGMSRRGLFRGAALLGATTAFGSAVVTTSAALPASAATRTARNVLVVLSLRGACDGLSLVVPHADPAYYSARKRIAVPKERLLAADDMFGLHPALKPLLPLWDAGRLAAVHATGLPAPNRSHFSAMEEIEDADPGSAVRSGWLNRLLGADSYTSPLQGMHMGAGVPPASLYGPADVMSARSAGSVGIAGDDQWTVADGRRRSLNTMWTSSSGPMGRSVRASFAAVKDFAPVHQVPAGPRNGARYPSGDLGDAMKEVARTLRGDVGVEVVTVDHGDWDMHTDIGNLDWGRMKSNAGELAEAIAAFFLDLGPAADNVTLVTLSEFGRRVRENDNWGTDHGFGNVMFLAGAGVKGGRYHGRWPGLQDTHDADLLVTTDYRSVLTEVVGRRFGTSSAKVFPGFRPETVGVMA